MRIGHRVVVLFALLAFSLQIAAAPLGLSCAHPAPTQSMQKMAEMDAHAHHQMLAENAESTAQLNCDMGCNCGGGCVHACQLSVVQPNFSAFQFPLEAQVTISRTGAPHQAYTLPLLRPPAQA